MPSHLGVPKHLWLQDVSPDEPINMAPPYVEAIDYLRIIQTLETPWEKLSTLKKTVKCIHSSILQYHLSKARGRPIDVSGLTIGADELMPLMMYIVIQSRMTTLYSEFKLLEEFIPDIELTREKGYYLVTLQSVLFAIFSLDMASLEQGIIV